MKKRGGAQLAGMLAMVVSIGAIAQLLRIDSAGTVTQRAPAAPMHRLYRASRIIGAGVRNAHDRRIGVVKDLILGSARGDIAYAVIGSGGMAGVGTRYRAVPWQALQASDDGRYYVLNADRATLDNAPGFDRARWPDLADSEWRAEVDRYWARMVGHGQVESNRLSSGVSGSNSAQNPAGASAGPSGTGSGAAGR